ncbi:AMP-binding protein [Achromobacter xylosoxidans]|uniref:AMP-binding protein n=1 Tax=Alcaligenes xylosoxydans xylosoxydans TaxID=85698 RepID=UPI0012A866FC|nr:AMP-binding protein [Achromobacter xylosoxidans]CUR68012.1 Surfactin synthase subunit 2 [Achromobacter xylosoxidans]
MAWTALTHLLLPQAAPAGDARVADEPALSRREFAAQCLAVAGALQARGARRAALWFEDAVALAIALFACGRAGITAVLPADVRPDTCAALDADIWLSDAATLPSACQAWRLEQLQHAPALPPAVLDPAQRLVLWTSGSSGAPKPVGKSWDQLMREVEALRQQWPDDGGPVLGSVSAQHMYGLPYRVLWPLCAGRPIDRPQRLYPEELQQASLRHATFTWIASPALLRRLGERLDGSRLRGRLVRLYCAGGVLPPDVAEHIGRQLGQRPIDIYGSSETGSIAWRCGADPWQPLAGVEVGLDPRGALRVASPWIDAADTLTADAAEMVEGGFQLLGRLDRIVKIEEKRVALPMLEQALARHAWVTEARVGQVAGNPRLTALVALSAAGLHILRNQGRRALVDALRRHLATGFESLAIPRGWRLLRQLPYNTQGKLTQSDFEAAAGPRPRQPAAAPLPADGPGECRYRIDVPYDLAHFSGHFPSAPVVPGVAQIGWAMALAQRDLQPALRFAGMEALKFQRLLRPGDTAELTLRWDAGKQKLYFTYTLGDQPCSSGRVLHGDRHGAA